MRLCRIREAIKNIGDGKLVVQVSVDEDGNKTIEVLTDDEETQLEVGRILASLDVVDDLDIVDVELAEEMMNDNASSAGLATLSLAGVAAVLTLRI